jgi:hypothetical protein
VNLIGEIIANFADLKEKYGLTKMFIMAQDVSHARGAAEVMGKVAASKGFEVTGTEIFPTGATDFSMALLKAKSTGSQILNIWMDMPESAILLKQWYDLKIPALPFGSTLAAAEQPGFWDATEGKGEYTLCNVVNAGNAPSVATPWTMKFYDAYTEKWGVEPEGLGSSSSYMAVYALKDAIERAGTIDSDEVLLYIPNCIQWIVAFLGIHIGATSYINDVTFDVAGDHLKEGEDVYIAINPLFHIMALGFFMAIGLNKGNMVVLMPQPQVDAILESIHRYRPRWFLGVPALYRMILENDRVSASEIEAVLQDHPTVINACVIGVPDEKTGERIKAIVVLKEDARGVGGVELIKWCADHLASYKVPGYVEFRDMLPKSKVGKLLRREVRDSELRKITEKSQT